MFCSKCGAEIQTSEKFCPKCGAVNESYQAPAAAPTPLGSVPVNSPAGSSAKVNLPALIAVVVAFICLFLPFMTISFSIWSYEGSESGNFFELANGFFNILMVLAVIFTVIALVMKNSRLALCGEVLMLIIMAVVMIMTNSQINAAFKDYGVSKGTLEQLGLDLGDMIKIDFGFWLYLIATVVSIILTFLRSRKK